MDAVSAMALSQALTQQQLGLIALRMQADSRQAMADLLARQVAEQALPASASEGLGGSVDTYA